MKTNFFTLLSAAFLAGSLSTMAQNEGTGVNWENGDLIPSSPLLINENFQGFDFFHSDENPDQGNSSHTLADDGETYILGYKEMEVQQPILNGGGATIGYNFFQCAFAPLWSTAYAYKNESQNTTNVSDGFVEVSRVYGSAIPTIHGYFEVDLRSIEFVEIIQWTHSSTGGNKRGVLLEFSIDNGENWDSLRYQPGGSAYAASFTYDLSLEERTSNSYNCVPSAYGMTWVEGIYYDNVMLRFSESGGQTPRIHDLKIYGDFTPDAVGDVKVDAIQIYNSNKQIYLSELANVEVYNLSGVLVQSQNNTTQVSMNNFPNGMYFVKALVKGNVQTTKLLIK